MQLYLQQLQRTQYGMVQYLDKLIFMNCKLVAISFKLRFIFKTSKILLSWRVYLVRASRLTQVVTLIWY